MSSFGIRLSPERITLDIPALVGKEPLKLPDLALDSIPECARATINSFVRSATKVVGDWHALISGGSCGREIRDQLAHASGMRVFHTVVCRFLESFVSGAATPSKGEWQKGPPAEVFVNSAASQFEGTLQNRGLLALTNDPRSLVSSIVYSGHSGQPVGDSTLVYRPIPDGAIALFTTAVNSLRLQSALCGLSAGRLLSGELKVGRPPNDSAQMRPDVEIVNLMCSSKHAKIGRSDDSVTFCDTGSTNGSFINGAKVEVNAHYVCEPGSVIELANVELPVAIARIPERIATMGEIKDLFETGKPTVEAQITARLIAHEASCRSLERVYPVVLSESEFPFLKAFAVTIEWLSPQTWTVNDFGPPTLPGDLFSNPLVPAVDLPAGSELDIATRFAARYKVRLPTAESVLS